MLQYDVVIIGASSAGLYAGELLASSGKKVAVFEKAVELSSASRTYIITPGIRRVLPDLNPALVRHSVDTIQVHAGEEQAAIRLAAPDLIIDRSQLIKDLYQRAVKAGVAGFLGCEFVGLEQDQGKTRIIIRTEDGEQQIKAGWLIGGDGVSSRVRQSAGLAKMPSVPLLQAVIDLPEPTRDSTTSQVWFDSAETPYFYWLIPDRDGKAVAGLIAESQAKIKNLLDAFLTRHNFQPISYQSGQVALYSREHRFETSLGDLGILLVGDAAGQVKVTTVGGSVTGLEGARAAAAAILSGQPYHQALRECQRELALHAWIRRLLNKMTEGDYQTLVQAISGPVRDFLKQNDRDAMRWKFWKLTFLQPKFIPLGLKLLLHSLLS